MNMIAVPFKQEGVQLYSGVCSVGELIGVCQVDEWRSNEGEQTGYQRAPESTRTRKVAHYMKNDTKPLLPTSILLSARSGLKTEPVSDNLVNIHVPEGDTLWIVDGQHRLFGLKRAIDEYGLERLREYPLPVVIGEFGTVEEEANQFRIINENMKKVRTDLARRLLALRMRTLGGSGRRMLREAGRLWEAVAVELARSLNDTPESPWYNRIQPPNVRKGERHIIRELSFTTSLKPLLTLYPYTTWNTEKLSAILLNYWSAWRRLVPQAFEFPNEYVLLKTPGVFSLHIVLVHVLAVLRERALSQPSVEDFVSILSDLPDQSTDTFWDKNNSDGAALAGSMKGFAILGEDMVQTLVEQGHAVP